MAILKIAGLQFVRHLAAPEKTVFMVPPVVVEALESHCALEGSGCARLSPLIKAIRGLRREIFKLTGVEV